MDSAIWTEKYRPKDFSEIKGQKEIVKRIKAFVELQNIPHLLFAGPAGVGKTTLALVVAKKLFKDSWHQNFLELNASDERGIDIIRNKVKDFARTKAIGDAPFKIIYLDEADALTREAQQALRRTMENYTKTTRFIISCVTPDTKILLPEQREIMVKEFIDQYEYDTKQIHIQNVSARLDSTKKDLVLAAVKLPASTIGKSVLELITMTGRKIKVTDDHKLLTVRGWKEAGKLTKEDKLIICPHLEGTYVESSTKSIVDIDKFIQFLAHTEEKDGLKTVGNASKYQNLMSNEKEKILLRIEDLRKVLKENKGLTAREHQLYTLIRRNGQISRKELQKEMGLTRIGINYLLPSLEKKGCIKRIVNKKTHSFIISEAEPIVLRNEMDIRHLIEKEFKIEISYTTVRKSIDAAINRGRIDRVLGELKRKDLLDITYNDTQKIGALTRICGFMLGDGHIAHNNIRLHFSGNKEALNDVKKDLDTLGYSNYSRIRSVLLKNKIRGKEFDGTTTSFTLDSRPLSLLLQYLKIPKGDKTITPYTIPKFVKYGTKYVKREFIRSLFGCDADKPNYKKMNFEALTFRQNKSIYLKSSILQYYKEISNILKDFAIDSYTKVRDKGEIRRKDIIPVLMFELVIRPNNVNIFKFYSKIGYAYENYKIQLAKLAAEYLRHKLHLIKIWQEKSKLAVAAIKNGSSINQVAKEFELTSDFVSNQIKGKEVHLPRNEFFSFDEWVRQYKFNDLLVVNDIYEIKEVNEQLVMDITCQTNHNFITNGFVSHNCNYSSKIIDPIQSRCAMFRFKPLEKKEIYSIIEKIEKDEKIRVDEKAKEALFSISEGDVRKVENILQSSAAISSNITDEIIYSMASVAKPKEIGEVLKLALENKFIDARNKLMDIMLNYGLSGLDIIKQIQQEILNLDIDNEKKMLLMEKCGEIEFRMTEGSDEFIQLEALLSQFALHGNKI